MAYTGATTGYAAGAETNTSAVDYALETTYNQAPTGDYQALRYTSFSLDVAETESQPDEINDIPEMAQSVLTGRTTSGSIGGILSVGTFEDLIAGVMGADWQNVSIAIGNSFISLSPKDDGGAGGLPSIWAHSVPSGGQSVMLFADIPNAGIVRFLDSAAKIDFVVPYHKVGGALLVLDPNYFAQTGSVAHDLSSTGSIIVSGIINGKIGKTFTFREALSGKWKHFTGTAVNQVKISLQKGQAATVDIDLVGSDMAVSDTDIAASVTPRTATPLINTVEGFLGCKIFGNAPAGCIQSATITLSRDGSGQDTGMGHVGACGVRFGSFKAALEITYLFRDYQQFTDWQAGKTGPVTISVQGADGLGYQFAVLNGILRNPKSPISGKNQTVEVTVSVTANPVPGGGTFAISRIGS